MKSAIRSIAAFGVLAALAATSNATITFSSFSNGGQDEGGGHAVVKDLRLNGLNGMDAGTYSGSFGVTSTVGNLIQVSAHLPTTGIYNGTLSVLFQVDGNTFYSESRTYGTNPDEIEVSLPDTDGLFAINLAANALHTVTYSVSYTPGVGDSIGYVDPVDVYFKEAGATPPVPEPASMAALGLGVVGLIARRKRGSK